MEASSSQVVRLEHVNIDTCPAEKQSAARFFEQELGLLQDPEQTKWTKSSAVTWFNVSREHQMHVPVREAVQSLHTASSEIVLTSRCAERAGTFVWHPNNVQFRIETAAEPLLKSVRLGAHSASLIHLERFWREMLRANVSHSVNDEKQSVVVVDVGPGQTIEFFAVAESTENVVYSGYHICIYIQDWEDSYLRFQKAGLLFVDHRFSDKFSTLEEARESNQFRACIVPDTDGKVVYRLELEIRSLKHPSFRSDRKYAQ